jgi:SAM-dependent methyltransferase
MTPPEAPLRRDTPAPRDFLEACLREWPSSHALLRAIECRKLWRYPLAPPILDVGCGEGTLTRFLFPERPRLGIDLRHQEVRRAAHTSAHGHVLTASATQLPFPDRSFRSVFSNCVLEHIDHVDTALCEIARVLQPEGVLLTTVPTPRWESEGPLPILRRWGLHGLSNRLNGILRRMWHHVTVEEEGAWRDRLARARFKLLVWEPYMGPSAYAAYGRFLPFSFFSFMLRRLSGRWMLSRTLRSLVVPRLARRLREPYLAEDAVGACALILAVRSSEGSS